ncbi:MAG TPA: relaxase/mobilization nuclease domain-containing protein [Gemmatimonadaceae bacterium]|jgi:hypothetical protein|nr:relaxase/mobilization nuclease domain-containing protein [Gemmatimonadaceae bacterium]
MIAQSSSGRAFGGLIRYLLHGRSGMEHSRVAWTMQRNLALDDPERAAVLMRATAAQNHRIEQPVYHLVVAFDPSDRPSPAVIRQVIDRLLDELRLKEHQILIVAHRDRAHPHLHIVVNRVHPETGRAWDRWHDHTIAERALRILERRLGLREVDGHLHQLEGQRAPERHEREPLHKQQLIPVGLGAEEFERITEAKRGIYDADLPRHLNRLEFQWSRTLEAETKLHDRLERANRAIDVASRAFYNALDDVYARAPEAMKRFDDVLHSEGPGAAIRRLRDDPTSYVELRSHARPALLGLWNKEDDTAARELLPRAVARSRDYAAGITELRQVLRQIEPGITRADQENSIRAETEFAARNERIERELARIRGIREQLPSDALLRRRAWERTRELRPRELAYLHRAVGSAVATLAVVLRHRVVRDIAMGREIDALS